MTVNAIIEYQMPTPVDGQTFQLTTINGSMVSSRVQGQNCFMSIMAQGSAATQNVTRTYQWLAMGKSWNDIQSPNFVEFFAVLPFPNASWILLYVVPQ